MKDIKHFINSYINESLVKRGSLVSTHINHNYDILAMYRGQPNQEFKMFEKTFDTIAYIDNIDKILVNGKPCMSNTGVFDNNGFANVEIVFKSGNDYIKPHMFNFNDYLYYIEIGGNIKYISGDAFKKCINLKRVEIKEGVEGFIKFPGLSWQSANSAPFNYCESLEEVILPNSLTDLGGGAFRECESLKSIRLPQNITKLLYTFNGCKSLTDIGQIPNNVTVINGAFGGTKIKNIKLPSYLEALGDFAECKELKEITIPASVTTLFGMTFDKCNKLERVRFESNTNIKLIDCETFNQCTKLSEINLPDSITCINPNAFAGCKSLTSLKLPNDLTDIGEKAFYNCNKIKEIEFGPNVENIDSCAFRKCASLERIIFPMDAKDIKFSGKMVFAECPTDMEIIAPDYIKRKIQAQFGCNN